MKKIVIRIAGVFFGIAACVYFFTKLLMPTWFNWNTDSTMKGIYKEPGNRIQVLFLGSSAYANGMSPMTLYNNEGLCAYNMGTPEQPLLVSYYWLQEIYRLHPETLNTVVLDTYFIFPHETTFETCERALTYMKFSQLKIEAFKTLSKKYEGVDYRNYLVPIAAYHNRWTQINEDDFKGLTGENNNYYTRGQNITFQMEFKGVPADQMDLPFYGITKESSFSPEEYQNLLSEDNLKYLELIVEFCSDHHLNLMLVSPLYAEYGDLQHDALQYFADTYGLAFLDFTMVELQDEIGLNPVYDYVNPTHPNFMGAEKITAYIGKFIRKNYGPEDIRGKKDYAYLEKQAEEYNGKLKTKAELMTCESFDTYLKLLNDERFTVFLTVKGDSSTGLNATLRQTMTELGLHHLAEINKNSAYIGILDRGKVITDITSENDSDILIVQGKILPNKSLSITNMYKRSPEEGRFTFLTENNGFSLASAGSNSGNFSYMNINGEEKSDSNNGINIVVYDNDEKKFLYTASFDTSSDTAERTNLRLPDAYLHRLSNAKLGKAENLYQYYEQSKTMNNALLFLVGNSQKQNHFLDSEEIRLLESNGLKEIAKINTRPYFAIIQGGIIEKLLSGETNQPFETHGTNPLPFQVTEEDDNIAIYVGKDRSYAEPDSVLVLTYDMKDNSLINQRIFKSDPDLIQ